jgi:glycosyltransferase involved in cell wall biosynthesis
VIAAKNSEVAGQLVETPAAQAEISPSIRKAAQESHRDRIERTLETEAIDLIHFHGLDFLSYRPPSQSVRQLATLHLPVSWYPEDLFQHRGLILNYVSQSQARTQANTFFTPVIGNGIDLDQFTFTPRKDNYLLWLGRVCPEKGAHIALHVARSLDLPLVLAGPVHPFGDHQTYFCEKVVPLLEDDRHYVGPVNSSQRAKLLSGARCLLVPALAPETSSLVAMEAAASGTPVIAFASGALPEIVENGKTGWIVSCEEEMADAVHRSAEIIPAACRRAAEVRFNAIRMAQDYLSLYERIINLPHRSE